MSDWLLFLVQGLFGTKLVHKVDSLVLVNRQHELYTNNPHTSWLSADTQVSLASLLSAAMLCFTVPVT